jgi:TPR repeat protein
MREIIPEERRPFYLRRWRLLAIVSGVAVLAAAIAVYTLNDQPSPVPPAPIDPKLELIDPKGMSMSELLARAEAGNMFAQAYVAEYYRDGTHGFPKDDGLRFKWALKAAEQSHSWAKVEAGICYFHGIGTPKDYFKAFAMFRVEATDSQDAVAQLYMGYLLDGDCGFPKRDDLAAEWFRKSADQGNTHAASNYGVFLLNGFGVPKDTQKAFKYIKLAADAGHLEAQTNLGWAYQNGEGVEKDLKEAIRLYRLAASKGEPTAANNLGLDYLHGNGVIKDDEEAVRLFRISAATGHIGAKKNLGYMYVEGKGVAADPVLASKLYLEVAYTGDSECQRVMGVRYQQGIGVPVDLIEAYAWHNVCAASGDEQSAKAREAVAVAFSAEQVLAAQKRSRELLKDIEAKKAKK